MTSNIFRALGVCYKHVKKNRKTLQELRRCQENHIADCQKLIEILLANRTTRTLQEIRDMTSKIKAQAQKSEETAIEEHQRLRKTQMEIHNNVAKLVQSSEKLNIESLSKLPAEIDQRVKNRDLLCLNLSRGMRAHLKDLLKTVLKEVPENEKSDENLSFKVEKLSSKLSVFEMRDEDLEQALKMFAKCVRRYNTAHCASTDLSSNTSHPLSLFRMGSCCGRLSDSSLNDRIESAVDSFERWDSTYYRWNSIQTDRAMEKLKNTLCHEAADIMGINEGESHCNSNLRYEFEQAGSRIHDEHQNQLEDIMAKFPNDLLQYIGRKLLEAWKAETNEIRNALRVSQKLTSLESECNGLAGSGQLFRDREDALQNFRSAKDEHTSAMGLLSLAELMQSVGASLVQETGMTKVPDVGDAKNRVRETSAKLTHATLKLTLDIQPLFPEVILFVGQGLPSELGGLWRPAQRLEDYDEKIMLPVDSRHRVCKVRDGMTWFVLKEYTIVNAMSLRTCINEAAIIHRHRHPCIVEICGLFQPNGNNSFFIQMPWYEHGTLGEWVKSTQKPQWNRVRAVLLDVLIGLAHLHAGKVIHGDVKPQNILVDGRERGRLADFDISIDTSTRVSKSWITAKTSLGFTPGFQAPEVMNAGKVNDKTDIYAFGITIDTVKDFCEPKESDEEYAEGWSQQVLREANGQTRVIVEKLTTKESEQRPDADEAQKMRFFSILTDASRVECKVCILCSLNGDPAEIEIHRGAMCSQGHFHCGKCLADLTHHLLEIGNGVYRERREARVMCCKFPSECTAPGFGDKQLANHIPGILFQQYLDSRIELLIAKAEAELEEQRRKEVEAELQRLRAMNEFEQRVLKARTHIEENILQMKCPRCARAFYDFDGCFAISCYNCSCSFCGWCLKDCGLDAHAHLLRCIHVPMNVDPFFPRIPGMFVQIHKKRCKERVKEYLATLDEATVEGVKISMSRELDDLSL